MNGTKKSNKFWDSVGRRRRLTSYPSSVNYMWLRNYWSHTYPAVGYVPQDYPGIWPSDDDPMPLEYYQRLMDVVETCLGYSYVYGGKTYPYFDCSGFVGYAYCTAGLMLYDYQGGPYWNTVSLGQYLGLVSTSLTPDDSVYPGDMLYWSKRVGIGGPDEHVAIYIGNNMMVEDGGGMCQYNSIYRLSVPFVGYFRLPRPYPIEGD